MIPRAPDQQRSCPCNSPDGHHELFCWAERFAATDGRAAA